MANLFDKNYNPLSLTPSTKTTKVTPDTSGFSYAIEKQKNPTQLGSLWDLSNTSEPFRPNQVSNAVANTNLNQNTAISTPANTVKKPIINPDIETPEQIKARQDAENARAIADQAERMATGETVYQGSGVFTNPTTPATSGLNLGGTQVTIPTTTTSPATTTPTGSGLDTALADIMKKYNITGTTTPPATPTINAPTNTVSEYGLTPEAIEANLTAAKKAIEEKYALKEQEAATQTENERQSNLSNIYSTGVVDPRSSGVTSVTSMASKALADRKAALNAAKNQEIAAAEDTAYGRKTSAQKAKVDYEAAANKAITDQYDLERQAVADTWTNVSNTISAINAGKAMTDDEKTRVNTDIQNMIKYAGGSAFEGMNEKELTALEKGAGLSAGTLTKAATYLKQQDLMGNKLETTKADDGSIYSFNPATGESKLLIKGTGGEGAKLTPAQINSTVNSIAGAFDNEPIVKSYNVANEGYQTINSIGVDTKSPADDIAFIYAFAKIMDPNSVVREGEYNTIQRYAQTWADNFGFTAKRIFQNTNFLSSDAKQKMLNALTPKINTLTSQYQNLASEYQRQIDDAYAGKSRQITNYAGGVGTSTENQNAGDVDWANI